MASGDCTGLVSFLTGCSASFDSSSWAFLRRSVVLRFPCPYYRSGVPFCTSEWTPLLIKVTKIPQRASFETPTRGCRAESWRKGTRARLAPLKTAHSAARPQTQAPSTADWSRFLLVTCGHSAAQTPVSTSPIPPLAIPGFPELLINLASSCFANQRSRAFQKQGNGYSARKSSNHSRRSRPSRGKSRSISPGWGVSRRGPAQCLRSPTSGESTFIASASMTTGCSACSITDRISAAKL